MFVIGVGVLITNCVIGLSALHVVKTLEMVEDGALLVGLCRWLERRLDN